jgi:hypothetical protein
VAGLLQKTLLREMNIEKRLAFTKAHANWTNEQYMEQGFFY